MFDFFSCLINPQRRNKPDKNWSLLNIFALKTSVTSNDLCVNFDPYSWTSYMKQGSVILLTKFGGPGTLFVNEVSFLVKMTFWPLVTFSWTLTLRSWYDPKVTIDFCPVLSMCTRWQYYFFFQNLTLFDLWPLNIRSHDGVTVDTFACLSMPNILTLLFLLFEKLLKCWPFWPLTR